MKSCDEMTNDLLVRREQYLIQKQKKKKAVTRSLALVCCAVLISGVGIWQSGITKASPSGPAEPPGPTEPSEQQSGATEADTSDPSDDIDSALCIIGDGEWWNGKRISRGLLQIFEQSSDKSVVYSVDTYYSAFDPDFVWNGKTLSEYLEEWDEELILLSRYRLFLSIGEKLANGLSPNGTPDNVWTKEYCETYVQSWGEEFISKYIVDGVLLRDKLEEATNELAASIENGTEKQYILAQEAYSKQVFETNVYPCLDRQQIQYGPPPYYDPYHNHLILYVTEAELAAFTPDDPSNWHFEFRD